MIVEAFNKKNDSHWDNLKGAVFHNLENIKLLFLVK